MTRCLRDKELVLLHEREGRPADGSHLEGCASCAARYCRLTEDLRVIRQVLESDPVPGVVPEPVAWRHWVPAVALVVILGLNALFAWEWFEGRRAAEPTRPGETTTEELIAAVEAMVTEAVPEFDAPEIATPVEPDSLDANAAPLYAVLEGDEGCQRPAAALEEDCDVAPAPGEALGVGFADSGS